MWYTLPDSNKQYPLSIERVQKIKALNQQGIRPDELEPVEVISNKATETEPEFVELVGQISLRSLDKADRKRRQQQQQRRPGGPQGGGPRPGPQQGGGGQQGGGPNRGPQQGGQQAGPGPQGDGGRPDNRGGRRRR